MSDNVHLVVALCGAFIFIAIIGLIFLAAFLLERCDQLRKQRDTAEAERDTSRALLKQIGLRPRPPSGGRIE